MARGYNYERRRSFTNQMRVERLRFYIFVVIGGVLTAAAAFAALSK